MSDTRPQKKPRNRPNRRRRDSDPESSGHRRHDNRGHRHKPADSPPTSCPRVVLLRPAPAAATAPTEPAPSSSQSRSQSPLSQQQPVPAEDQATTQPSESPVQPVTAPAAQPVASRKDLPESRLKLIDPQKWCLNSDLLTEYIVPDGLLSSCFKVVSVVGTQSSGKSKLMNAVAGRNGIFPCHGSDDRTNLLQHVTKGIDMMITAERMFLLDSQPLLSSSVLDDFINSSIPVQSIFPSDLSETDLLFITSVHIVYFLMSVSDCLIVTNDWLLDVHLVRLISTSISLMDRLLPASRQINIIWYYQRELNETDVREIQQALSHMIGGASAIVTLIHGDEDALVRKVMRTGRVFGKVPVTEKEWLVSAQRLWDNLVKKPSMYSEFIRMR